MEVSMEDQNAAIKKRIEKDINMFYENLRLLKVRESNKKHVEVVELSKMYASDSKSYLDKGDFYTSFSCISYAHGLLDAIRDINQND